MTLTQSLLRLQGCSREETGWSAPWQETSWEILQLWTWVLEPQGLCFSEDERAELFLNLSLFSHVGTVLWELNDSQAASQFCLSAHDYADTLGSPAGQSGSWLTLSSLHGSQEQGLGNLASRGWGQVEALPLPLCSVISWQRGTFLICHIGKYFPYHVGRLFLVQRTILDLCANFDFH